MYLCVCNAVSENKVVEAIQSGCSSFIEISTATGLCAQCGQCAFKAKKECDRLLADHTKCSPNRGQFPALVIDNSRTPHTKFECA